MSKTQDILGKPTNIEFIGDIYPVLIKDYDEFMKVANALTYSYDHFDLVELAKIIGVAKEELKLLDLITIISTQTNTYEQTFNSLASVFSFALRKQINYLDGANGVLFHSEDHSTNIDRYNYDEIRQVVMRQNLIFTPKVFKNKLAQEWAEKVLKARAKSSSNITLEDILTTVSVMDGKHYWDLENYTYYQVKADFDRICKIKNYDSMSILLANPYAGKLDIEHFAESMDMHKNPYDDVFKSKNKLQGLNNALGSKEE